jgi:hypothetical protein
MLHFCISPSVSGGQCPDDSDAAGCRIVEEMKRIMVFADFDFLSAPQETGAKLPRNCKYH